MGDALLERVHLLQQFHHQRLSEAGEFAFALPEDLGHVAFEGHERLEIRNAALAEQASGTVDKRSVLAHRQRGSVAVGRR
jgi:hypothetical protein